LVGWRCRRGNGDACEEKEWKFWILPSRGFDNLTRGVFSRDITRARMTKCCHEGVYNRVESRSSLVPGIWSSFPKCTTKRRTGSNQSSCLSAQNRKTCTAPLPGHVSCKLILSWKSILSTSTIREMLVASFELINVLFVYEPCLISNAFYLSMHSLGIAQAVLSISKHKVPRFSSQQKPSSNYTKQCHSSFPLYSTTHRPCYYSDSWTGGIVSFDFFRKVQASVLG
jgi:hypothetical protein